MVPVTGAGRPGVSTGHRTAPGVFGGWPTGHRTAPVFFGGKKMPGQTGPGDRGHPVASPVELSILFG